MENVVALLREPAAYLEAAPAAEELVCALCSNPFTTPVLLECFCAFDRGCLAKALRVDRIERDLAVPVVLETAHSKKTQCSHLTACSESTLRTAQQGTLYYSYLFHYFSIVFWFYL